MKSPRLFTLACMLIFLASLVGFGVTAYEAYHAGDASHAIVPFLNCILAMVLLVNLILSRREEKRDEVVDQLT